MRLPLLLLGILLLAVTGLLILWVPAGQTLRIVLPFFGPADPGIRGVLMFVWLLTAAATAMVVIDAVRFSRWFRPDPPETAAPALGIFGWLFGFPVSSGAGRFLLRFQESGDLHPLLVSPVREIGIAILLLLVALIAAALGQISLPRALVLATLLAAALSIVIRAIEAIERDPVELRSGWGGLGGGLGGWRLSRSAVLLLLTLVLIGAAAAAAWPPASPAPPQETPPTPPSAKPA